MGVLLLGGCSAAKRKKFEYQHIHTQGQAASALADALDADDPDMRREAILGVAKSRFGADDTAWQVFDVVARTDPSEPVRCAAVRALERIGGNRAARPLLMVLEADDYPAEVVPPGEQTRWDVLQVLEGLCHSGILLDEPMSRLRQIALQVLAGAPNRDARLCAARILSNFADRQTLEGLIEALRQRDFGVVYESERSLMYLTGVTHEHDPEAWRFWLRHVDDPFAQAGALDHLLRAKPDDWWTRTKADLRRSFGKR